MKEIKDKAEQILENIPVSTDDNSDEWYLKAKVLDAMLAMAAYMSEWVDADIRQAFNDGMVALDNKQKINSFEYLQKRKSEKNPPLPSAEKESNK